MFVDGVYSETDVEWLLQLVIKWFPFFFWKDSKPLVIPFKLDVLFKIVDLFLCLWLFPIILGSGLLLFSMHVSFFFV